MRTDLLASFLLAFVVLSLSGCGRDNAEPPRVADPEITVDESHDASSVTITGKDGEQLATMTTGTGAQWPDGAPAYASAYPGATVTTTMTGQADHNAGSMVAFETTDSPEEVIAYYRERAAAAGLDNITTMAGPDMTMFAATNPSGETGVSVQASSVDGKTTASVTYSNSAK